MFFLLLENSNNKVTTNISNIRNIANTLFSVIKVFIVVCKLIFNKLSKSLLKIKCRLTDKNEHIPILKIMAIDVNILLFILFLLYWNSTFLLFCKLKEHLHPTCKCSDLFLFII